MIRGFQIKSAVGRAMCFAVGAVLLSVPLTFVHAQDGKAQQKLPERVNEVTQEDLLHEIPNFFSFDYPFSPQPGKRLWLRVDDKHWIERYPDGLESRFKILGRATVRGQSGTIVVKIEGDPEKTATDNEGGFQVFIPDKGTDLAILIRSVGQGDSQWLDMSWSQNRKTIIQNVE